MELKLEPQIQTFPKTQLVGKKISMSFAENKTVALWKSFMPYKNDISHIKNRNLYSVEVYSEANFFKDFDLHRAFEKWAAVAVNNAENIPEGMEILEIPEGLYAVFTYVGKPSEAAATYQYIYGSWIPQSPYQLDDRPHLAIMGEKYKGEDPHSEETFWIPLQNPKK